MKIQLSTLHIFTGACLYLLLLNCHGSNAIDPISIGVVGALGALGYTGNLHLLKDYTYCKVFECCNDDHTQVDVQGLSRNLTRTLFGQHIVVEKIVGAIRSHFKSIGDSKKPLVLGFHGPPGTGKNFVADRVAEHIYKLGARSKYVHKFLGRIDFPLADRASQYGAELKHKIKAAIKECPRSLFIFDEVDKMPAGVFDGIAGLMDHHTVIDGLNFREAVYIFLSNAGGVEISEKLLDLIESGTTREETKLSDFDPILQKAAYNVQGGLKQSHMIDSHLVDHFIPFLPLEKSHVEDCIEAEFRHLNKKPNKAMIDLILKEHVTYQWNIFSTTGCKRLSKLVGMLADDQ